MHCRLIAAAFLLALALFPGGCSETSVKPGINQRFLSPELDLDWALDTFEGERREVSQARDAIARQLELAAGESVADIGAGTGLFLEPFSKAVGDGGKVIAVDIAPPFIAHIVKRAAEEGWTNVEALLGDERTTHLEAASVDVVFVCDTYHHFEYPRSMLESIHRALRPGGRLVIVDFERIPGASREWILNHVRAGKAEVIEEITSAGFRLEDQPAVEGLVENYLLRFRRP